MYEERRQARIDGLRNAASRSLIKADSHSRRFHSISDMIPFGQPILVGHHSEKHHRRDIERMDNALRGAVEEREKAECYTERAEAAESNRTISSDDPQAAEKIKAKIAGLEANQELMKSVNKTFKQTGRLPEELPEKVKAAALNNMAVWGKTGLTGTYKLPFPSYELTNNNGNISRLRKRVLKLEAHKEDVTTEKEVNGVKIVDNVFENRLQLFFPSIPTVETRTKLKRSGFHWSPSVGCWQRQRSNAASYQAEEIIKEVK